MPGALPDPPPTPWATTCTLMLPIGRRCMRPRVRLDTPPVLALDPNGTRMVEREVPRVVLVCLSCDFGGAPDAGPPRFVDYVRRGSE